LQFEKEYEEALQVHLRHSVTASIPSRAARSLGRKGLSLGLGAGDLARAHERAAAALASQPKPNAIASRKAIRSMPRSSAFLIEALSSFEKEHGKERATAREQLDQEALRYSELLAQSQQSQDQARRVAHQLLLAQEEERK